MLLLFVCCIIKNTWNSKPPFVLDRKKHSQNENIYFEPSFSIVWLNIFHILSPFAGDTKSYSPEMQDAKFYLMKWKSFQLPTFSKWLWNVKFPGGWFIIREPVEVTQRTSSAKLCTNFSQNIDLETKIVLNSKIAGDLKCLQSMIMMRLKASGSTLLIKI